MGSKESARSHHRRRREYVEARVYDLLSPQQKGPKCKEKVVEFVCSCCLMCVCCPIASVCCIKLPCKMCQQALQRAWKWARYGSKNRDFADYSSFSDIDSDVAFEVVLSLDTPSEQEKIRADIMEKETKATHNHEIVLPFPTNDGASLHSYAADLLPPSPISTRLVTAPLQYHPRDTVHHSITLRISQ
ncbi:Phospholipid scramblase [Senna tora]|uniref:Phospholipid scramblase n=1 Tax=Senna tora TaxID=362788 RepID=A0A835CA00_9FABA|nr:Phospholipid scramblase [Senna tora]